MAMPRREIQKRYNEKKRAFIAAFKDVAKLARDTGDTVTENFLLGLIEQHQKTRWQLKSYLK